MDSNKRCLEVLVSRSGKPQLEIRGSIRIESVGKRLYLMLNLYVAIQSCITCLERSIGSGVVDGRWCNLLELPHLVAHHSALGMLISKQMSG
jgi:hypothetical protein